VTVGLLKIGIFVTHGDLEQSLRAMETSIRAEYATKQDIEAIKALLNRLDIQISRMDDRLNSHGRRG
jgi:ribosome-associated translation inhibitor RaiA